MKIIAFIKNLLPKLHKESLLEDISITQNELNSDVLPSYSNAADHFKVVNINSQDNKLLEEIFYRNLDQKKTKITNVLVSDIYTALLNVKDNVANVEKEVDSLFSKDIIREGLTVRKAVLIRAVEHLSFITRFSVDFLNLILINEAENINGSLTPGFKGQEVVKKDIRKKVFVFARLLKVYGNDKKFTDSRILTLPEVVLNDETINSVTAMYDEKDLDPIASELVTEFEGNPIYHIRLVVAEWQANRYKSYKDKKKMIELRLLHIKSLPQSSDLKLEKEIDYLQNRVDSIDYKLKKMEDI